MKEKHVSLGLHFRSIFRHREKVLATELRTAGDCPATVGGRG